MVRDRVPVACIIAQLFACIAVLYVTQHSADGTVHNGNTHNGCRGEQFMGQSNRRRHVREPLAAISRMNVGREQIGKLIYAPSNVRDKG
jgi:hypothetical protein